MKYETMKQKFIEEQGVPVCACGCGEPVNFKRGIPNKYVKGHQLRNISSDKKAKAAKIGNKKRTGNHKRLNLNRRKYIDAHGYPQCKVCGKEIGFFENTSKPRTVCPHHVKDYINLIKPKKNLDH